MASNNDDIAAGAVNLELEAMRTDDCSWQPCEISFSPTGGGLVVKYEDNDSEDTLTSEKEALMRIRARSLPLQDDDCAHIKPGETVLVNRDSEPEGGFFDAKVEKVTRVRHSKRAKCRCSFMIRWLNKDVNGESLTVPSSSVMRLANKSINNHPTISAFIDAVQLSNSSDSDMSPQMDIVGDFDLDLHNLLEKQIEGIRNSVHGSKKRIRDEISMFEDVSKPNGRTLKVEISTEKSHSRRSTRSQKQKGGPKKQESPVIPPPTTEVDLSDKKSPLNPLAARAALASLMSHKSLEISVDVKETKTFTSSETDYATKPEKIVKKLFSPTTSSELLEEEEEDDEDDDDDDDDDDKMNNTETSTRSTRGKVQKVKVNGTVSGNKVSAGKKRRRSAVGKKEETETIETTTVKHTTTFHVQKDKNTLFATSSPDNEVKNSIYGRRRKRSVVNNEVSEATTEETETKSTPGPTAVKNKKTKTSGKTQDSGGNVMSNGGRKGLVELKAQRVRCSPRLNPKT
ncbi:unnamed protein product [Lactuca saligna]|uniref:SAWADEE domain-containing protein n=1 Tax=Lactuca saligna TaxID=75948 RepID=A0AA35ZSQ9_LACSI|nr:unnamed protein product [Lactuca saligna]